MSRTPAQMADGAVDARQSTPRWFLPPPLRGNAAATQAGRGGSEESAAATAVGRGEPSPSQRPDGAGGCRVQAARLPLLRPPLRAEHAVWREPDLETGRVRKTDLGTDAVALRVPPPPTAPESIGLPVPKPIRGDRRPTEEPSGCVARSDVVAPRIPVSD